MADCALVTLDNLELFAQKGLRFISRLLHTFAAVDLVKGQAHQDQDGEQIDAAVLSEKRGATSSFSGRYFSKWSAGWRPWPLSE